MNENSAFNVNNMACLPLGRCDCLILDVYRADLRVVVSYSSAMGWGGACLKLHYKNGSPRIFFHPTYVYQIARSWVSTELGQGQC